MNCFVIMGVAGCGKTTIGEALAPQLDGRFVDGDSLHPPSNIAKMASGIPLDDTDRAPWLKQVGETLRNADDPIIVGCSALKRSYRDLIRQAVQEPVGFIHLIGTRELIAERMAARARHFMPLALLESQFAALEPLAADETGCEIDIALPLDQVTEAALNFCRGGQ